MPDLLLELRSEEIPARMQRKAAGDLRKMITDGLVEAGLTYEGAKEYWTPRRLTLDIRGLTARSRDVREEIKGPSTKAPEQAVQGFLRKAGLADISQAHVQSDPKKGAFYVAVISKPGRSAEDIIAELVPAVIRGFPWPKSMRWGPASKKPGSLRWVRPLQSILCTFGPETEEPLVVDFEVDGIRSGNVTWGHRFHAPEKITVRRFDDYVAKLEKARVILDAERRKRIILDDAKNLAFANGLELVEDDGLLEEVSGLVEWPVVLMGEFEQAFLEIPPEVVRLTIRANQKCFVCATPNSPSRGETSQSQKLSNRFILTANIDAKDGGAEIAHGNGKVVRARLSDALYFWNTDQADLPDLDQLQASVEKFGLDLAKPLDQRMARLDHLGVTFHAKLGTQGGRVERIRRLAGEIAPTVGADPELAARAAVLAKADLTTEIVGEFPELQGAMGRKYALLQGEHASVAAAIEEHYKPQGPTDFVPTDPVSIAVALADKLDTLVGFWAIDEKPTGSKDPYALRRAALGVIRIVVENEVRLGLQFRAASLVARELLEAGISFEWAFANETRFSLRNRIEFLSKSFPFSLAFIAPNHEHQVALELLIETKEFEYLTGIEDVLHSAVQGYELAVEDGSAGDLAPFRDIHHLSQTMRSVARRIEALSAADAVDRDAFGDDWFASFFINSSKFGNGRLLTIATHALEIANSLLAFFHDRLKVYLRDKGARHDLIDAVLAGGGKLISPLAGEMPGRAEGGASRQPSSPPSVASGDISPARGEISQSPAAEPSSANDDLLRIVRRVEALSALLDIDEGKNLLAGTRRAANILAAEEKKGTTIAAAVDASLFREETEKSLFKAVNEAESKAAQAIQNEDFFAAMRALAALREPVDSFFEKVLVNDEDASIRANRLALLARIRAATGQVADFSKIAG